MQWQLFCQKRHTYSCSSLLFQLSTLQIDLWLSHRLCFPSSDHERVALGNEEGLFVIHVTKDGIKGTFSGASPQSPDDG